MYTLDEKAHRPVDFLYATGLQQPFRETHIVAVRTVRDDETMHTATMHILEPCTRDLGAELLHDPRCLEITACAHVLSLYILDKKRRLVDATCHEAAGSVPMVKGLTLADFVFERLALEFVPLKARSRAMPTYLEPNEIVAAIENAFSPLECRVESLDHRLGFCVFDADGTLILPLSSWVARLVRKPDRLRSRINVLRQRVEAEGYTLDPWTFAA